MIERLKPVSDIATNQPYTLTVTPKVDGAGVATDVVVKAAIVASEGRPATAAITSLVTLTFVTGSDPSKFTGTFSTTETNKLLSNSADPYSKLRYERVWLLVQVAGYQPIYRALEVQRGLATG